MAAQTFTAPSFYASAVHLPNFPGVIERSISLDLDTLIGADGTAATVLETNDVIKVFKLPANAKLLYGRLDSEDIDSGTTLTLTLRATDGTTTKNFIVASTVGQAGGFTDTRDAAGVGVQNAYSANSAVGYVMPDNEIDWRVEVLAAAGATGAGADNLRVTVGYTMAVENGEVNRVFPTPNP